MLEYLELGDFSILGFNLIAQLSDPFGFEP